MVYIFSYQKSQYGYILESLDMEIIGISNGHFEKYKAVWYIYDH
jgi:hypothetical protein